MSLLTLIRVMTSTLQEAAPAATCPNTFCHSTFPTPHKIVYNMQHSKSSLAIRMHLCSANHSSHAWAR